MTKKTKSKRKKGDQIALTAADEKALDKAWARLAKAKGIKQPTKATKKRGK